jgi:DNA-binding NtrC family response regulator
MARLVVLDGPDVGVEFAIPLRGGGIGRGEDNAIQLSDLAVSRSHCSIEPRAGGLALVDASSRNRTLVNGAPITVHVLTAGDEITIGHTRMAFVPGHERAEREARPSRVTIEVGSGELLRQARDAVGSGDGRARRHLAALATLGDALRAAADRGEALRAACQVAVSALAADRAFVLAPDERGALIARGSSVAEDDPDGAHVDLAAGLVSKVLGQGRVLALEPETADGRGAVLAPLAADGADAALLLVDRRPGHRGAAWDEVDLLAAACVTHLLAAAIAGADARAALAGENRQLVDQLSGGAFVGRSVPAQAVLGFVAKVGPTDATVLLGGESGSGKEMVARAIHRASRRAERAFIAVNCAALTETLLESELFGHERGAFTGATERKLGRFELADGGTLFLDEVGELGLDCQTKFLRVLEEQEFERVGGSKPIKVDVRVVAATNRDLDVLVAGGGFRQDLYYRLSVIHTVVPPLRARVDDVPLLAEHFLARLRRQVPRKLDGFAPDALRALMAHPWPGNVRELRNAIEYAIVLGSSARIERADLPPHIGGDGDAGPTASVGAARRASAAPPDASPAARPLRELEREGIIAALAATSGNKAQAAAILEIDRSTLYKKLKEYGIG